MKMRRVLKISAGVAAGVAAGLLVVFFLTHSTIGCDGSLYWSTLKASSDADQSSDPDVTAALHRIEHTENWAQAQPRCIRENYLRWTSVERAIIAGADSERVIRAQADIDASNPSFPKPTP